MNTKFNSSIGQAIRLKYFLFLCLLLFYLPTSLSGQISHFVQFSQDDLAKSAILAIDGNQYEKITMVGLSNTGEPGKPNLPIKYVRLLIPSDQDVDHIELGNRSENSIIIQNLVYPSQPPIPTALDVSEPAFVPPDSTIYFSDKPFPERIVEVVHSGYFDGNNHIITIAVYPVQYYPKFAQLVFFSSIDFSVKFKSSGKTFYQVQSRKERYQKIYDDVLKILVDNPQDIPKYQVRPSLNKKSSPTDVLPAYDYVIITSNALKPAFNTFISWKKRKGLDIGVVTVEEILANYSGDPISGINDDAGSLREYLFEAWISGTVWALLAGDYSVVPIRYGCGWNNQSWSSGDPENPEDFKIPADLYFADFNGDWDTDGDEFFGQPAGSYTYDAPDYNPEIFLGRLLCSSTQDIEYWTKKLLNKILAMAT